MRLGFQKAVQPKPAPQRWVPFAALFWLASPAGAAVICAIGPADAAAANAASYLTLAWAPFRRDEIGWATYAPALAQEIATGCPPTSPGFAAALARWQRVQKLPATGIVDVPSFAVVNALWTMRRPFVAQTRGGLCPSPPDPGLLAAATAAESYGGKTIQLDPGALAAWRRLTAAARTDLPALRIGSGDWLRIFSGFRAPAADDLRCANEANCQGVIRAACSSHRTGRAIDSFVGTAPGMRPDSSEDTNRRAMSQTPAYRWLVRNAGRFGFQNYVFEPWHWEWSGQIPAPLDGASAARHEAKP